MKHFIFLKCLKIENLMNISFCLDFEIMFLNYSVPLSIKQTWNQER